MRLTASLLVLLVTALDVEFGRPEAALHIAALTAGALLAASVIIDRFVLRDDGDAPSRSPEPHHAASASDELPSNPGRSL